MADQFDLWELIAAPIRAMNEAEAGAATRFVELLLDYALEPPPAPDPSAAPSTQPMSPAQPALREVSFAMRRPGAQGQIETRQITLPLLQLVPIGGVSINEATLTYGVSMSVATGSGPGTQRLSTETGASAIVPRFVGRLAQTGPVGGGGTPPTDANLTIEIKLKQMDLPQGVIDLLQHTQGGLDRPLDQQAAANGNAPLFTATVTATSAKVIQPKEVFKLAVHIAPKSGLLTPLHVSLSVQPIEALTILAPDKALDLTAAQTIEIQLLANEAVTTIGPDRTAVVAIRGTAADEKGAPLELVVPFTLALPPN